MYCLYSGYINLTSGSCFHDPLCDLFCVTHVHVLCTGGIERTTQERNSDIGGEQQKMWFNI